MSWVNQELLCSAFLWLVWMKSKLFVFHFYRFFTDCGKCSLSFAPLITPLTLARFAFKRLFLLKNLVNQHVDLWFTIIHFDTTYVWISLTVFYSLCIFMQNQYNTDQSSKNPIKEWHFFKEPFTCLCIQQYLYNLAWKRNCYYNRVDSPEQLFSHLTIDL